MTQPPSWATSVPSTPGVHTEPPSSTQWENLTQEQIGALRTKLIQSIEQVITQDLTGGLVTDIPAADQLTEWATNLPSLGALITALTNGTGDPTAGYTAILQWASSIPGIGPFITAITNGNVDPSAGLAGLQAFFNFPGSTSGIMSLLSAAGADFIALVKSFIPGYSGTDQSQAQTDYGTIVSNVMSLLGNPAQLLSGSFNPVSAAQNLLQQVLTPAGALTTATQIPPHLFGSLTVGSSTAANVLPDSSFADPSRFDGDNIWEWSSLGRNGGIGSAQLICNGTPQQLIGFPIPTKPGQITNLSTYVFWTGVHATAGNAFVLAANAYDANENPISDPANRVLAVIANPTTNAGDGNYMTLASWQQLTGSYTAPANTAYVHIVLEVEAVAISGTVNFDDCSQAINGLIDASLLGNMPGIPTVPGTNVEGSQGIADVLSTFGHLVDGLGSAYGGSGSGLSFAQLFGLAQSTSQDAASSLTAAHAVATTQAIVINRPAASGLESTVESNIGLTELGTGSTPSSITITQAVSRGSFVRLTQAKTLGFLQWYGYISSGTISAFYINFATLDASGNLDAVFSSVNYTSQLNTAFGWQLYDLTTLISGNPGDEVFVEFQVIGSGTYTIAGLSQAWMASHPSASTKLLGITRNTGASGPTALALTATQLASAWNNNAPMIGLGVGVADIPVPVQAPVPFTHTVHGTYTDTPPTWWRPGIDFLDRIALGPGGGGDSGTGGSGGTGTNTTMAVSGHSTLVGTAAPGANSGGSFTSANPDGFAPSPNPFVYNGIPYYGGNEVGPQQRGGSPGGGGGGGEFSFGGNAYGLGANGGSWAADTIQPTSPTVTSVVGTGGQGQPNFSAGSGADGAVWGVWRQNTNA